MKYLALIGLYLFSSLAFATEEILTFSSTEQEALYRQLTAELRCPKCQNQNIADSNAVVAVDMRKKTYELVRQGQSHDQVIDYMKQRYGDFVHYLPPVRLSTIWLWLLPLLLIIGLASMLWRRQRQAQHASSPDVVQTPTTDAELQQMIDAIKRDS